MAWGFLVFWGWAPRETLFVVVGALFLAALCAIDDWRELSPAWRLPAQATAVGFGVFALPPPPALLSLPPFLTLALLALAWLWFLNLFNFMDGIDGLAGSEAAFLGFGLSLLAPEAPALFASALAGAALGFLYWNWSPARIFLGDVGSVPIGYLLGFLLLDLALAGGFLAALILPLYFLADASLTLARRLLRGERIWKAHREHFYQRAVEKGLAHAAVVRRVLAADLLLLLCAFAAERGWGAAALAFSVLVVAALLAALAFAL